jgi:hypothetical protein
MSIENCHCPPFGAKALVCTIGTFRLPSCLGRPPFQVGRVDLNHWLRIVGANMSAMTRRVRRLVRSRNCKRCGSNLQLELQRKYDSFWIISLIWLGTALVFSLVGLLLIGAGLWLWPQKQARWVCPSCA